MKYFFLLMLVFINPSLNLLFSQEFQFDLYFEDSKGNRDTVTIGIAEDATLGIDAAYGEINIFGEPLNADIDVRLSNRENVLYRNEPPTYVQSKKQVYRIGYEILTFEIYSSNFPIKCYWEEDYFKSNDEFRLWMTSHIPGGWFDVGGGGSDLFYLVFKEETSPRSFSSQLGLGLNEDYSYLNENGDSISLFWLGNGFMGTPIREIDGEQITIDIFPNPTRNQITIKSDQKINQLQLFDVSGKLIRSSSRTTFDISDFTKGVYFLTVYFDNGNVIVEKVLKL